MATKRTSGDTPNGEEPQPAARPPAVDPDSMSAPDQEAVQQLHAARTAAQDRGDEQAVADIDTQLAALQEPQ